MSETKDKPLSEGDKLTKKYFKWNAADKEGKKEVRTHLQSQQLHMRRQRLARVNKLSPDVVRQIRSDVRKEVLGDSVASAMDYMKRNMSATIFFSLFQRHHSKQMHRAFFIWKYSKLCISCLRRERLLAQAEADKEKVAAEHRSAAIIRVARRYLQRAWVAGAFKEWKDGSKEFAERTQRKKRALKWFTNRKSMMGFQTWRELLTKRAQVRKLLRKIIASKRRKMLIKGWKPWARKVQKIQQNVNKPRTTDQVTPLYTACEQGFTSVVHHLLQHHDINVNQPKATSETPLYVACYGDHTSVVDLLLKHHSIQVNQTITDDGSTPLFIACHKGYIAVVNLLLQKNDINVNQHNYDPSKTPLFIASACGHVEIVRLLLQMPNINLKKQTGAMFSPLDAATARGFDEIVELLKTAESAHSKILREEKEEEDDDEMQLALALSLSMSRK